MGNNLFRINKTLKGRVEYNDGTFAEIQTVGVEGIETDLFLARIHINRCEVGDALEEFGRKFQVGMWLEISTTIEIKIIPEDNREKIH